MSGHGDVTLHVSAYTIEITRHRQKRFLLFWKRWRADVLARKFYRVRATDRVALLRSGSSLVATVNDKVVLSYPPGEPKLFAST